MLKSDSPSLHRGQSPGLRRPPRGFPPACVEQIGALKLALDAPQRPVAAIVGGSKVSTKIDVLGHLAKKVDFLIIGGGMVNTFLFAKGSAVGKSLHELGAVSTVEDIQRKAAEAGCKILLPVDAVVASELKANVETAVVPVTEVPAGKMILDVGPASVKDPADIMLRSSSATNGDG